MKRIAILICVLLATSSYAGIFVCTISGPTTPCPGSSNIAYTANKNLSGNLFPFTSLVWTISGSGHFIANGNGGSISSDLKTLSVPAQSGDFTQALLTANVTWDNVNNTTPTLTATFNYVVVTWPFNASFTGSLDVNLGVIGSPNSIQGAPASICTSATPESFTLTCPNSLTGTNANKYVWSVSGNATVSSGGSNTATLTKNTSSTSPIVVSVKYYNTTCGEFSASTYSITIPRCTGVPSGAPIMNGGSGIPSSVVTFTFLPGTGGTSAQISLDGITFEPYNFVNLDQGTSEDVWARSVNDCGDGLPHLYHCTAPPCPKCLKTVNKTGVSSDEPTVKLFPNPASNYVTLEIPALSQTVTVSVISMDGQIVRYEQLEGGSTDQLDIQSLSPGMYAVHIISQDGVTLNTMQKMLITR